MSPQSSIAHYRITSKLGQGGMGEVWRATDTKLNRDVAIKIIPEVFAQDAGRMARFAREAQVLASLNHPNIAAIYGVEEGALIMELVEGLTLAQRILQGPMPVDEALPIARQIAEALDYAHEHAVVHRDLKPANIKITPEGRVKVLDFGLAKALWNDTAAGNPTTSPTVSMGATLAGTIMGTAAYMSPEQARGQPVDRRADIWAFGVVLHEMLTGRALFQQATISDTLAAVLRADPDWSALPSGLPANIRTMLQRCLERDPRRRLRDIGDAHLELEQPAAEPIAAAPVPRARRSAILPWIVASALAVVAATMAAIHMREASPSAPLVRFSVPAPNKMTFRSWLGLSPDGRYLGFTAASADSTVRLWLRSLDTLESRPLAGTEGTVTFFWSPDSRFVVFQSAGKLKKIDLSGGPPQMVCDVSGTVLGGAWSANGVILFGSNIGPILRVPSSGGVASPVTMLDPSSGGVSHSDPVFMADGRHFLYLRRSSGIESSGVYAGSLDVEPARQSLKRIQATEFSPGYAPPQAGSAPNAPGHLLFVRDGTLMAQTFDEGSLATAGEAVAVVDQVGINITRAFFSVSASGVLAYRTGGGNSQFSWYDRDGRLLGQAGQPGNYADVALSPDASRVAYELPSRGASRQVWVLDIARGANTRLTVTPEGSLSPVWSADGKRVAFSSIRGLGAPGSVLSIKDANNSVAEEAVYRSDQLKYPNDWSRDGRFLLYTEVSDRNGLDLWALPDPLAGGDRKPIPIANSPSNETQGQVSPDSHWVAYASDATGKFEIYVRPFPPGDGRPGPWLVSAGGGGLQPRWRADGRELFYFATDSTLMAADVKFEPAFESGTPHALFTSQGGFGSSTRFRWALARDGKRFLLVSLVMGGVSEPATVVLNWQSGLKK